MIMLSECDSQARSQGEALVDKSPKVSRKFSDLLRVFGNFTDFWGLSPSLKNSGYAPGDNV